MRNFLVALVVVWTGVAIVVGLALALTGLGMISPWLSVAGAVLLVTMALAYMLADMM